MKPLYWFCYTLSGAIARVCFQYRAYGQENIIEEGPAIMAANHQSYLDPPLVGITCRNELYYLARKTLFDGPEVEAGLHFGVPRGHEPAEGGTSHRYFSGGHTVVDRRNPASSSWNRHDYSQDACACGPDSDLWIV